jgi:hypothetical protein
MLRRARQRNGMTEFHGNIHRPPKLEVHFTPSKSSSQYTQSLKDYRVRTKSPNGFDPRPYRFRANARHYWTDRDTLLLTRWENYHDKTFAYDHSHKLFHCICTGSIWALGLRRLLGSRLRDAKGNLRFQLQLYCRCDQRNCHASQSRKISRLRRKVRRGSRFGNGPRQSCRRCGQIVRNVRSGDLERPLRNGTMLGLLDRAPQLKDATAGTRRGASARMLLTPSLTQRSISSVNWRP